MAQPKAIYQSNLEQPLNNDIDRPGGIINLPLVCAVCGRDDATSCANCQSTAYCSENCRALDAPCHNLVCESVKYLSPRPPCSISLKSFCYYKLGFLFFEREPRIQPLWIKYERNSEGVILPVVKDIFPLYVASATITCNKAPLTGTDPFYLQRELGLCYYHDKSQFESSRLNEAVLAATNRLSQYNFWRGPVLLLSKYNPNTFYLSSRPDDSDVCAADIRTAVDYMAASSRPPHKVMWKGGPNSFQSRIECMLTLPSWYESKGDSLTVHGTLPGPSTELNVYKLDESLQHAFTRYQSRLKPDPDHVPLVSIFANEQHRALEKYLKGRDWEWVVWKGIRVVKVKVDGAELATYGITIRAKTPPEQPGTPVSVDPEKMKQFQAECAAQLGQPGPPRRTSANAPSPGPQDQSKPPTNTDSPSRRASNRPTEQQTKKKKSKLKLLLCFGGNK